LVVYPKDQLQILSEVHDNLGHWGFYVTRAVILQQFWWPHLQPDIVWFIQTCHICQVQQTTQVCIPPTVVTPAPLFAKIYINTMHMPVLQGFKYIVQGHCSVCTWPEFHMLHNENVTSIVNWIYQDIICHWGALREIVTNNGSPFLAALAYLKSHYQIRHIHISGYNSRANGIVERAHLDVQQALFKAADGVENKWSQVAYAVFQAERVTVRHCMGCSPYYATTGTHPLIPLDITEATYLLPPPDSILSTTDLIAHHVITLQKHNSDLAHLHSIIYQARVKAAITFKKKHFHTIHDFDFKWNDLVLMQNTKIEYTLNKKMKPRYDGPFIVISRNCGGAYILCQLNGSVFHRPIAAFCLLPYHACDSIYLPDDMMDIDTQKLRELEQLDIEVTMDYVDDEEEESENQEC